MYYKDYNSKLKKKAKALRMGVVKTKSCLWEHVLQASVTEDVSFKRQRVLESYGQIVLSFADEEVFCDIRNIQKVVENKVKELKSSPSTNAWLTA